MSYRQLRDAVRAANLNQDANFTFREEAAPAAARPIMQLHVSYDSGNEYLRLDQLLDQLRRVGAVQVFEFRGRGTGEPPKFVADVRCQDATYQLLYHLPNEQAG